MPDQLSTHVVQAAKSCTDPAIFCWMESHPGLASWAQFAGSMLAIMIALLAAWLPRYFDKLDRRSRAQRARPLLGEAMSAAQSDALRVLRCSTSSPNEIKSIDLNAAIAKFEKVSWVDLSDRDHSLGMFAYRHLQQFASEKQNIEQNIGSEQFVLSKLEIMIIHNKIMNTLYINFLEEK